MDREHELNEQLIWAFEEFMAILIPTSVIALVVIATLIIFKQLQIRK